MASVVCQGSQSCLEPQITESTFLTHKMSSKPSHLHQKPKVEVMDNSGDQKANKNNGFSFFDVLHNPSSAAVKHEQVYVHPMVKRSASALSTMSLEMCTESLGTETGSDVSESSDEFNWEERERFGGSKGRSFCRKVASHRGHGFPPPLTSISGGSDGTVKVRPHRENGRLVIKAVSVSDCGTKFETERTDGRLRLSLLKDCCVNVESGRTEMKYDDGKWGREVDGNGNRRKGGGKNGIQTSKRQSRLPKSLEDSTEFKLSSCKDNRNGNRTFGNLCLFRVVIS